jgi:glycosyltransferase involved in cell wall biosynthesis
MVEDGSKDRTPEIVRALSEEDERLVAIFHGENKGRSWAIRSGFDAARGEVTVIMDSDRQYEPKEIPALVEKVREGWDVVSGRRDRREDRFDRKLISRVYNLLIVRGLLRTPVVDQNSGLKAFRSEFSKGMGFDPTGFLGLHRFILPLAQLRGGRILEVPCAHYERPAGRSYIKSTTVPFITLRDLRRFRKVYVRPAKRGKPSS